MTEAPMTVQAGNTPSGARFRWSDFVLGVAMVGMGIAGFVFPPVLPDDPASMAMAMVLSLTYAAAIGAGLLAPFRMKARGAVVGIVLMGVMWMFVLSRALGG
jgi:hypothetical protein